METWYDWKELESPAYCAWCGAKTRKLFGTLEVEPGEEYRGNAQVVSRKPYTSWTEDLRLNRGTYKSFQYGQELPIRRVLQAPLRGGLRKRSSQGGLSSKK